MASRLCSAAPQRWPRGSGQSSPLWCNRREQGLAVASVAAKEAKAVKVDTPCKLLGTAARRGLPLRMAMVPPTMHLRGSGPPIAHCSEYP
eukprot:1096544-Prymnesium_polylepis.1